MVEFSLILLPLLAMLFLILDLAWVIFASASLQEAAREGVRFAITGTLLPNQTSQDASIRKVVEDYSFGFINSTNVGSAVQIYYYLPTDLIHPQTGVGSNAGGNVVKVVITGFSVHPLMPLWRSSSAIPLSISASDIVEPSPNGTPPAR